MKGRPCLVDPDVSALSTSEAQPSTDRIFDDILAERRRQDEKWGPQRHEWPIWSTILTEETGEVAEASLRAHWSMDADLDQLLAQLIQVAAAAVHMVEHIDELKGR
jgi:NTP pyrophosphatase (non-canonical NTP hydrolase)